MKYLRDAEAAKDAVMNIYQELLEKLVMAEALLVPVNVMDAGWLSWAMASSTPASAMVIAAFQVCERVTTVFWLVSSDR